jgi:hypothetical protein
MADTEVSRTLKSLADSPNPTAECRSLGSRKQEKVYRSLWAEYKRLEKLSRLVAHRIPRADRALMSGEHVRDFDDYDPDNPYEPEDAGRWPPVMLDDGRINIYCADGYDLKAHFQQEWRYSAEPESSTHAHPDGCNFHPRRDTVTGEIGDSQLSRECLFECISSQLLLYRLTAVFGMPPTTGEDGYRSVWSAVLELQDQDEFKSVLELRDLKGGADAFYRGSHKGAKSAQQLIEWLLSDNVPHTYDHTLAGTVA